MYRAKYARYLPEKKRRENVQEIHDRHDKMHLKRYGACIMAVLAEARQALDENLVLPAMRVMQFAGEAIELDNARAYNCVSSPCNRKRFFAEAVSLLMGGSGVGYSVQKHHVAQLPPLAHRDAFASCPPVYHIVQDTKWGWADAVGALLDAYWDGVDITFDYSQIRKRGTPMVTSGGKAPGPEPLRRAINLMRPILDAAAGRNLTPIECHDLICIASDCVLSGGTRRSALIALFSWDDHEMMEAKSSDHWHQTHPWRQRANNSAMLLRRKVKLADIKRVLKHAKRFGDPGLILTDSLELTYNPCFESNTRIATESGWLRIEDMAKRGEALGVITDDRVGKEDALSSAERGVRVRAATPAVLTQQTAVIYELSTTMGHKIRATANHIFPTLEGRKKLEDLAPSDTLLLPSGKSPVFGTTGCWDDGFVLGLLTGDGCVSSIERGGSRYDTAWVDLWPGDEGEAALIERLVADRAEATPAKVDRDFGRPVWCAQTNGSQRIGGIRLHRWLQQMMGDVPALALKQRVPECVWGGSEDMIKGYLAGLFYTDGSPQAGGEGKKMTVSLRLSQANERLLLDVQTLLSGLGMHAGVYSRREAQSRLLPDGKGGHKAYPCQEMWELILNRPNCVCFEREIKLPGRKGKALSAFLDLRGRDCQKPERHTVKVKEIRMVDVGPVYCLTQPETNTVIANGVVAGQCVEIGKNPWLQVSADVLAQLQGSTHPSVPQGLKEGDVVAGWSGCNLTTQNASRIHTPEDFFRACRAASILGTLQAGYTDLSYLGPISEMIFRRDALLGVSICGIALNPALLLDPDLLRAGARVVLETNAEVSAIIGINPCLRGCCIKPDGNSSQTLGGIPSGLHAAHAKRALRNIEAHTDCPIFQAFAQANPHMVQPKLLRDGRVSETDAYIVFAQEAPEGAICRKDVSAVDFLEQIRLVMTSWVEEGTRAEDPTARVRHNVSNTIYIKEDEWDAVAHKIYEDRAVLGGLAMFSDYAEGMFPNAPYRTVDNLALDPADRAKLEAQWDAICEGGYNEVDYDSVVEVDDVTAREGEAACAGGACLV
jgi:ribonucleotide reductase, class II